MTDLTVEILREIRDEIRITRVDLGQRIDVTNGRLDRLERQQTSAEVHLATEIVAVAQAIDLVRQALAKDRDLRGAVADHETRLQRLEGAPSRP